MLPWHSQPESSSLPLPLSPLPAAGNYETDCSVTTPKQNSATNYSTTLTCNVYNKTSTVGASGCGRRPGWRVRAGQAGALYT